MDARVEVTAARASVRVLPVGVLASLASGPGRLLAEGRSGTTARLRVHRVRPPPLRLIQVTSEGSVGHAALPFDVRLKGAA